MKRELRQPIDYRTELMDLHRAPGAAMLTGCKVIVVSDSGVLEAVQISDEGLAIENVMNSAGAEIVGIGRLVERVETAGIVAWRPFYPVPQLVPLTR